MMIQECTGFVSRILLVFGFLTSFSQNNSSYPSGFYAHLKEKKLYSEQLTFLKKELKTTNETFPRDTLFLHSALCFYQLNDSSMSNLSLDSIRQPLFSLSGNNKAIYLPLLFIHKKIPSLHVYLSSIQNGYASIREARVFLSMLKREAISIKEDTLIAARYPLKDIVYKYRGIKRKSVLAAGLLSALVPGLGKLYVGNKYQAFSGFLSTGVFAAQGVEALLKSGVKSVHFGYACSLFSIYYLGNIAGSMWAAKKKKHDQIAEIDYEIASYYSTCLKPYSE